MLVGISLYARCNTLPPVLWEACFSQQATPHAPICNAATLLPCTALHMFVALLSFYARCNTLPPVLWEACFSQQATPHAQSVMPQPCCHALPCTCLLLFLSFYARCNTLPPVLWEACTSQQVTPTCTICNARNPVAHCTALQMFVSREDSLSACAAAFYAPVMHPAAV